jgi:rhodanese-related sulfurtransferase
MQNYFKKMNQIKEYFQKKKKNHIATTHLSDREFLENFANEISICSEPYISKDIECDLTWISLLPKNRRHLTAAKFLEKYAMTISPELVHVTPIQLIQLLNFDPNIIIVDVRTRHERKVSYIVSSHLVSEFDTAKMVSGATLVAYDTIGFRSTKWLLAHAKEDITMINLSGGIIAWSNAGLGVVCAGPDGIEFDAHNLIHIGGWASAVLCETAIDIVNNMDFSKPSIIRNLSCKIIKSRLDVIINGEVYDLINFMHPGGNLLLLGMNDHDVTGIFYSVHSEPELLLKFYGPQMRKPLQKRSSIFLKA